MYYVERAYRTPDFGMWERGSKYNDGTPEIHASSIGTLNQILISEYRVLIWFCFYHLGMAKSALEAINGCNLFGEKGASWSVVYVDIDAHNRNRSIFETMLPRESSSKVNISPTVGKLRINPLIAGRGCISTANTIVPCICIARGTSSRFV